MVFGTTYLRTRISWCGRRMFALIVNQIATGGIMEERRNVAIHVDSSSRMVFVPQRFSDYSRQRRSLHTLSSSEARSAHTNLSLEIGASHTLSHHNKKTKKRRTNIPSSDLCTASGLSLALPVTIVSFFAKARKK